MTTLTLEQQQALDRLFAAPPPAPAAAVPVPAQVPDLLSSWLGLSRSDVSARLTGLLADKAALEQQILAWAAGNPLAAAGELLGVASLAFYVVEKGANPKINSLIDAVYYITTCASVGYADVFAVTQPGRAIAALVMTVGPALAARIFDRPAK